MAQAQLMVSRVAKSHRVCRDIGRGSILHSTCTPYLGTPSNEYRFRWYSSDAEQTKKFMTMLDRGEFKKDRIRNFCIVAHIDHGKSTLADRLLEQTGTLSTKKKNSQFLDRLSVEQERGITVKAQTASMYYSQGGDQYLLNLIDTPGHIDFTYEVVKSLSACEAALLLVDATQGIEAQTVTNFYLAFDAGLEIIPVINKIDQQSAEPERIIDQIESTFDIPADDSILISAKTGLGVDQVLKAIAERGMPPKGTDEAPPKVLLFDSWYDSYRGVISVIRVIDGALAKGDTIRSAHTGLDYEVQELGIMYPDPVPVDHLYSGYVGYVICNMKSTKEAVVGDTFFLASKPVEPLPGFRAPVPMVYAGMYPADTGGFDVLKDSIERLTLNDSSVTFTKESSNALGTGFRCGFLGVLHRDVFHQRLEEEYGGDVIATTPTVQYKVTLNDGTEIEIENPAHFPDVESIQYVKEPMAKAVIVCPSDAIGSIMTLLDEKRGEQVDLSYVDSKRVQLTYRVPMSELVTDTFDKLKSASSGYASLEYEDDGYQESDIVKMDLLLNREVVDALSVLVHRSKAQGVGRKVCQRLREVVPRQMYEVSIQAAIGRNVLARETLKALRKNVIAKCYGGDVTRKKKLLAKQKEGKKRMKNIGSVQVPNDVFLSVLN